MIENAKWQKRLSTDEDLEDSQAHHITSATLADLEKKGGWMTAAVERGGDRNSSSQCGQKKVEEAIPKQHLK